MSNFWQFCLHMGNLIKVTLLCLVMHIKPIKRKKIEITHEHVPCFRKKTHCFIHAVLILFFKMGHNLPRDTIPADPVDP